MFVFFSVRVCVCVGFVMCVLVFAFRILWFLCCVFQCMIVSMCGFCNVWVYVWLGILMCGYLCVACYEICDSVYVVFFKCVRVCLTGFCNVWVFSGFYNVCIYLVFVL